ncbi:MAG: hypothetical protein ABIP13_04780 [Tepidiformaceae bacterium]
MQPPAGHGLPHESAPAEPRRLLPELPLLLRGLALLAIAVGALAGLVGAVHRAGWLALPLAPVFGLIAALAGWSAAIHLTGGERFDDHPWV